MKKWLETLALITLVIILTFTSKFFVPRDSLLGEIFTDSNFGSLGNRLPTLYESKKFVGREFENERKKHD